MEYENLLKNNEIKKKNKNFFRKLNIYKYLEKLMFFLYFLIIIISLFNSIISKTSINK